MYPDLSYFFHDFFGTQPDNAISVIKTFGFFLVLALLTGALIVVFELRRKEREGLLEPQIIEIEKGKPASIYELVSNGFFGFILGFKFMYIMQYFEDFKLDPAGIIFSGKGNWLGGVVLSAAFVAFKWYEKHREALPQPQIRRIKIYPHERIGDLTMAAAISGVAGAKLAAMSETLYTVFDGSQSFGDWFSSFFEGSGLSIYGGLILAFFVCFFYLRRLKINAIHVMDAVAPALMFAYAVGRMGCHFSGDGDWGIPVKAFDEQGQLIYEYTKPAIISFLPDWVWAFDYPRNVIQDGIPMEGCNYRYCHKLPIPVFSTPIYEITMASILGSILWLIRKRITIPGMLFFIYVIMNGMERYAIESIRVNERFGSFGAYTQAELIAMGMMVIGVVGCAFLYMRGKRAEA